MFIGTYNHTLDEKYRVKLPASFRQKIDEGVVIITKGDDKNLVIYTLSGWNEYMAPIQKKALSDYKYRKFMRAKFAMANEVKIDAQGRVLISKSLLDYANLGKDVLVVGVGDVIELWAPEIFESELEEIEQEKEEFLEYMANREKD